jgi:transposase
MVESLKSLMNYYNNRRSFVKLYTCACSFEADRDLNGAINLKNQIGRVPSALTPVEITALQRSVFPISLKSIVEAGNKYQKLCG